MLYWLSASESGRERIAFLFPYTGSLYVISESLWPITMQSKNDVKQHIV